MPGLPPIELLSIPGIALFNEADSVFDAMLDGWGKQQSSRRLRADTVLQREQLVRRFRRFTESDPWQWRPQDLEEFTSSLLSGPRPLAHSTIRSYHVTLRLFCEYITSSHYQWVEECLRRFDASPMQICLGWNTASHLSQFEGKPSRRPFDYHELQQLFDTADARVDAMARSGRKGALAAARDAQLLKTAYAFGLRRQEVLGLDVVDLRSNPNRPEWGTYGVVQVRNGKSSNGGPAKRRTVLGVPEFDWVTTGLRQWVEEFRDLFDPRGSSALWLTERRGRLGPRTLDHRFQLIREEAGLPPELTMHCLRHSYVTHLIEFGYSQRFVQDQVGHAFGSTTAIYTSVGDEYRQAVVSRALSKFYEIGAASSTLN